MQHLPEIDPSFDRLLDFFFDGRDAAGLLIGAGASLLPHLSV